MLKATFCSSVGSVCAGSGYCGAAYPWGRQFGGDTLRYRNFSIQMHKTRRIALIAASNVTAEKALKRPEGGRAYDRKSLGGIDGGDREK